MNGIFTGFNLCYRGMISTRIKKSSLKWGIYLVFKAQWLILSSAVIPLLGASFISNGSEFKAVVVNIGYNVFGLMFLA